MYHFGIFLLIPTSAPIIDAIIDNNHALQSEIAIMLFQESASAVPA
jgi:hypothetical protein